MGESHFNRLAEKYRQARRWSDPLYAEIAKLIAEYVRGRDVLDVGNGGQFLYDLGAPRSIVAMDIAPNMLAGIEDSRVTTLVGDAREMHGIADGSVDVIVFALVLHHITGRDYTETMAQLDLVLATCERKLRAGGRVIIVESLLPRPIHAIERALFGLTRLILARLDTSMIFFFSRETLATALERAFDSEPDSVRVTALSLPDSLDPLAGSFPGLLKIPGWLSPTRFTLFVCQKCP